MERKISKQNINFLILICILAWMFIPKIQNFTGMIGIFSLILLWILTSKFEILIKKIIPILCFFVFYLYAFVFYLLGTKFYGGINFLYFTSSFILFAFPSVLCLYYGEYLLPKKYLNFLIFICIFFFLVANINTLIVLIKYPYASRILATTGGEMYAKMGAGGYGFAYGCMLLFPVFIKVAIKTPKKSLKFLYIVSLLISFVVLVICQYTTLLIILLIELILCLIWKTKWYIKLVIVIVISLPFIFQKQTGNFFLLLSQLTSNLKFISSRLLDIAQIFIRDPNYTSDSARFDLYLKSLNGFLKSPIIGTAYSTEYISGGHSTILDTLSLYGFVGLSMFVAPFVFSLLFAKREYRFVFKKDSIFFVNIFAFTILSVLNPTIYIYQLGISLFLIVPLFLSYTKIIGGKKVDPHNFAEVYL